MDFFDILLAKKMGGGKATLIEKTITENGTYNAVDDEADGYSSVTVDVVPEFGTNDNKVNYSLQNNIVSVNIPDGVTSIANNAFQVSKITSINIGSGVTKLPTYMCYGCTKLVSVNISESVTSIGDSCFLNCSSLTNINIPSGVTNLESNAFSGTSITSIKIPSGVTNLPYRLLNYCTKLKSVNLSEGLTSIGKEAFYSCSQLPSIDIPSTVTSIGDYVFVSCNRLKNITVRAVNPPTIQSTTFNLVPNDANIYVPAESVEAYKAAQYWSGRAAHIQAIQE